MRGRGCWRRLCAQHPLSLSLSAHHLPTRWSGDHLKKEKKIIPSITGENEREEKNMECAYLKVSKFSLLVLRFVCNRKSERVTATLLCLFLCSFLYDGGSCALSIKRLSVGSWKNSSTMWCTLHRKRPNEGWCCFFFGEIYCHSLVSDNKWRSCYWHSLVSDFNFSLWHSRWVSIATFILIVTH